MRFFRNLGDSTADKSDREGAVLYDILFHARRPGSKEEIDIIINLEIQNEDKHTEPFLPRAVYYACRLISSQKEKYFRGKDYFKLKKVYSIWICPTPLKEKRMSVNRYSLSEERLVGKYREPKENYDLLSIVRISVGDPRLRRKQDVLQMLNVLFSSMDSQKKCAFMKKNNIEMDEEWVETVTIAQGFYWQGERDGIEKGIGIGVARGRTEGIGIGEARGQTNATCAFLRMQMRKAGMTKEQAMDFCEIPQAERARYSAMLG